MKSESVSERCGRRFAYQVLQGHVGSVMSPPGGSTSPSGVETPTLCYKNLSWQCDNMLEMFVPFYPCHFVCYAVPGVTLRCIKSS